MEPTSSTGSPRTSSSTQRPRPACSQGEFAGRQQWRPLPPPLWGNPYSDASFIIHVNRVFVSSNRVDATCRSPPDEQAVHLAVCSNTSWTPSVHSACKTDKSKLVPKVDQMKPCCNKGVKASRFRHVAVDQRKSSDMYGMVRFILETIPGNTKTMILDCDYQQDGKKEWSTHLSRTYSYFSGQRILARFSGSNMAGS